MRLRERFHSAGPDALSDYELLEMVLFTALSAGRRQAPGQNPDQEIRLVRRSYSRAGNAAAGGQGRWRQRPITEIKLIAAAATRIARGEVKQRTLLSSWSDVIDYCRTSMAFADKEQFRILFLDKRNQLISDEVQQTGTVDHTPVYPREVIKRALELSATAIMLVHNHPSGDPTPSSADIQMTRAIVDIATPLGISVHDHIIVGKNGHASLKGLRLI